jgi:hypothetical protein
VCEVLRHALQVRPRYLGTPCHFVRSVSYYKEAINLGYNPGGAGFEDLHERILHLVERCFVQIDIIDRVVPFDVGAMLKFFERIEA